MKTPIHPISYGILPHSLAQILILVVCVWCAFHTNRGNSPERLEPGACPFGAGPTPLTYAGSVWRGPVSRSSEKASCAGNLMPSSRPCSGPMGIP